ncbi:hypothetical protein LCR01_10320 [Companilactobacillus crustorum]|uniref:Uncharacterized protein n=1 Tax=Companilactobacillus crustorum TaxID=392416 RepID=A0AB34ADA7_9LACO|nr:hypothetical protein BI355_0819 [Companilactobacillus crustorum]GEO76589.1 hypothetical protein LCR01_10320 [Companilactobacillus crustorum]
MKLIKLIKSLLKTGKTETSIHEREILAELEGENKALLFNK